LKLAGVEEAASILKVSQAAVLRYIADGRLPAVKLGHIVGDTLRALEYILSAVVPKPNRKGPAIMKGQPFTRSDPLWDIVDIGQSKEPTNVAKLKDDDLTDDFDPFLILDCTPNSEPR